MDCSVVMITQALDRERLELLQKTMRSLRKCTQYPHELVVVDNGPVKQTQWLKTQKIHTHIVNEINLGMGRPRNQGAKASQSKYLVFIDNDLFFYDNWLTESTDLLERYSHEKIVIAPMKTIPMKKECHRVGELDGHSLWDRAGSGCLVFRRTDWETIGPFETHSEAGREYGERVIKNGYFYLLMKEPKVRHVGRSRTWRRGCVCVEGEWVKPKESKKCQSK